MTTKRDRRYRHSKQIPVRLGARTDVRGEPTQAERIIERFGGPQQLQSALLTEGCSVNLSTIYRWMYPRKFNGRHGHIPRKYHVVIRVAAATQNITLLPEDFT